MINNKIDFNYHFKKSRAVLKEKECFKDYFFYYILKFLRTMIKAECHFYTNTKMRYFIYKVNFKKIYTQLGILIPINTFVAGLSIASIGVVLINRKVKINESCIFYAFVIIDAVAQNHNATPFAGSDYCSGPGAKLYGDIQLGNNVAIGANALVNKSFEGNCILAGIPAKVISESKLERNK